MTLYGVLSSFVNSRLTIESNLFGLNPRCKPKTYWLQTIQTLWFPGTRIAFGLFRTNRLKVLCQLLSWRSTNPWLPRLWALPVECLRFVACTGEQAIRAAMQRIAAISFSIVLLFFRSIVLTRENLGTILAIEKSLTFLSSWACPMQSQAWESRWYRE